MIGQYSIPIYCVLVDSDGNIDEDYYEDVYLAPTLIISFSIVDEQNEEQIEIAEEEDEEEEQSATYTENTVNDTIA